MLHEIEDAFVVRMKEDWDSGGSEAERLDRICKGLFDVAEEHSSLLRLLTMTTDVVYENGMLPGDIIQEQIGHLYREGMAEGAFLKGDPDMMAAMAHGLDIALSGPRSYDDQVRDYPFVNADGARTLGPDDIDRSVQVLWKTWALTLGLAFATAILMGLL